METLQKTALILTIVGAINWGFVGIFDFNLVTSVFGIDSIITRIIYSLIALTGIINIGILFNEIREPKTKEHAR